MGGECGNPNPRRRRLTEAFIEDFQLIWEQEGIGAIQRVARNDPSTFLRVAASLMPRDINLNVGLNAENFCHEL